MKTVRLTTKQFNEIIKYLPKEDFTFVSTVDPVREKPDAVQIPRRIEHKDVCYLEDLSDCIEENNMDWKVKLLKKEDGTWYDEASYGEDMLGLRFFKEKGFYSKGRSFSDGIEKLVSDYTCELTCVYYYDWFMFKVVFYYDSALPCIKVDTNNLEDGVWALLDWLERP